MARIRPGRFNGTRQPNHQQQRYVWIPGPPTPGILSNEDSGGGGGGGPTSGIFLENGSSYLLAETGSYLTQES